MAPLLLWIGLLLLLQDEIQPELLEQRPDLFVPVEKCSGKSVGPLQINHDGLFKDHYIIISQGGNSVSISADKNTATLKHGARAYVVDGCERSFQKNIFTQFYLLGKTFRFTTDLSMVSCGCNMAVYLVSMPGCGGGWTGDYYCDANGVTGQWCPEIDLMEANKMTLQVAGHKCKAQKSNKCEWTGCDQKGSHHNFFQKQKTAFKTILKNQSFDVATSFITDENNNLVQMATSLIQGSHVVSWSNTDEAYMKKLTQPLKEGMVLVFSYWGGGGYQMAWLDVPPCSGSTGCDTGHPSPISHFQVLGI